MNKTKGIYTMKKYESPEMEVAVLVTDDITATGNGSGGNVQDEGN